LPRDLTRIPFDARYPNWDVINTNVNTNASDGVDASIAMYRFAGAYFPQMASGLPLFNRDRPSNATNKCPDATPLVDTPTPFSCTNDDYAFSIAVPYLTRSWPD